MNPFIYETELLKLTVLGGIQLTGLDRMRATLKAEIPNSPKSPLRHHLDLYHDDQVEKFIRKCAEKLELGVIPISSSLHQLINQLEEYRNSQQEESKEESKIEPLNHEEREKAEALLKDPKLMEKTNELLGQTGIIGEEVNRQILFLAMTSRQTSHPLSVITLAKSGAGKSHLQEKVASCMPSHSVLESTQLTENSFYYYGREELKHKIFLIEDLDGIGGSKKGVNGALYAIRELQSKQKISKRVVVKNSNGHTYTQQRIVEGPVSIIGASTQEKLYEDNANRSLLIHLDPSKWQDDQIQAYQKQCSAGQIDAQDQQNAQEQLQNLQHLLQPYRIVNPYALDIQLPPQVFKARRSLNLLLHFIEAITFYHQYQRQQVDESTGEIYLASSIEDIQLAFQLLQKVLLDKSYFISHAAQLHYEHLQKLSLPSTFKLKDVHEQLRIHPRTLQRHMQELSTHNYVEIVGGNQYKGYHYQLKEAKNISQAIQTDLHHTLNKLKDNDKRATVRQSTSNAKLTHPKQPREGKNKEKERTTPNT